MKQELTNVQKFSCWLVEKGSASKFETIRKAEEYFGEERAEYFLMWGLDSGAFYCVDNMYYPTEGLQTMVRTDQEHRPEAHKNPLDS